MPCHAIDSTSISRTEATRVYCKDPGKRGERIVARSVPGRKEPGTLTINAWSQEQSDLLHRLWQKNCMFGAQTHLDVCGLPTDPTAYKKILDYYGIIPGGLDYSNMDNLEGGEGVGLQLALSCTYDDLIEVLKIAIVDTPATYTLANANVLCVAGDLTERCASDCGIDQARCEVLFATTDMVGGAAASQLWYSTDSGVTWTVCAAAGSAPFGADLVDIPCGVIIDARWVVFGGTALAGYPACGISDDDGATWVSVLMGGTAAADYVTNCWLHDAGNLWACGGEATPSGHIWFSPDRGDSWTFHEDVVAQILNDIHTADGDTIYTVGNARTVLKSVDAGASWAATTTVPGASAVDLMCVRALTNDHVLVGGKIDTDSQQLWCTLNGGVTWTPITFTGSTTSDTWVNSLDLAPQAPKQHVWMIHGKAATANDGWIFRSLDGGYTWERWTQVVNDRYRKIFACDSNNAWAAGDMAGGLVGDIHHAAPVT
jgi:photosystem II stability/assembly factor-like uncharacterized protein